MAQVRGFVVDNIDFPKKFIRQALIRGGFSIQEVEFDKCRGTSHVIIWLQSKRKYNIAKDCFLAYQVEKHTKLYVKQAPKDATPAPKRHLDENEHPKLYRLGESLRTLIRDNDALKARQAAAAPPSEAGLSLSANTIPPTGDLEQQPIIPEEADATVVVQVQRSPRMMEPDQGRKRFRGMGKHEPEEIEEIEDSQEGDGSPHKRQRA